MEAIFKCITILSFIPELTLGMHSRVRLLPIKRLSTDASSSCSCTVLTEELLNVLGRSITEQGGELRRADLRYLALGLA